MTESQLDEEVLTLEDVALLIDRTDQFPLDTLQRLRNLVTRDTRFSGHVERLEAMAREAELGESRDRMNAALLIHRHYRQLEQAEDWWHHPAEVLDPDGTIGVYYKELLAIARARANAGSPPDFLGKLEAAWVDEQAKNDLAEDFATRLLTFDPSETDQLLFRVAQEVRWLLRQRRRAAEAEGQARQRTGEAEPPEDTSR